MEENVQWIWIKPLHFRGCTACRVGLPAQCSSPVLPSWRAELRSSRHGGRVTCRWRPRSGHSLWHWWPEAQRWVNSSLEGLKFGGLNFSFPPCHSAVGDSSGHLCNENATKFVNFMGSLWTLSRWIKHVYGLQQANHDLCQPTVVWETVSPWVRFNFQWLVSSKGSRSGQVWRTFVHRTAVRREEQNLKTEAASGKSLACPCQPHGGGGWLRSRNQTFLFYTVQVTLQTLAGNSKR